MARHTKRAHRETTQRYMHEGPAGHTRLHEKQFPGQRVPLHAMPDGYERKLKKYHKSLKGTGGRRRKHRSTRRH